MAYWIKPIGSSNAPVPCNEEFDFRANISFSNEPTSIQTGDILIVYAVKHKSLISIFKVLSIPFKISDNELLNCPNWRKKYHWTLHTENLNKEYSDNWFRNNLNIYDLESEFKNQSKERITETPGNSLNGLQYGNSYMELSKSFSSFLTKRMSEIIN